jgi:hypothetical protein
MPRDVLRRHAVCALRDRIFVMQLLFSIQFALGVSVEIGSIHAEDEYHECLGVHAGRAAVGGFQLLYGRRESLLELHGEILGQNRGFRLQLFRLEVRDQRVNHGLQFAVHELGQLVGGESDAVIGDAILGEVVGADLFAAVA